MIPLLTGLIGGALDIGTDVAETVGKFKQSKEEQKRFEQNMAFQREAFEYQKELNQLQMNREDTAVQRYAKDLQAAGMNPLLAAGSQADTGSYTSASPSTVEGSPQNPLEKLNEAATGIMDNVLGWVQTGKNIQQTQLQNELIQEEILNQDYKRRNLDSQTFLNSILGAKNDEERKKIIYDTLNSWVEYQQRLNDYQINRRYGIRNNDQVNEYFNTYKAILGEMKDKNSQTHKAVQQLIDVINKNQDTIKKFFKSDYGKSNDPFGDEYNKNGSKNIWYDYPMP